ncbi:MAG: integration host factor subunit alpha [Alphaproteobacteria bacterium]
MSTTLTRADIIDSIYREVGLSKRESADILQILLDEISDSLIKGDTVKISSFGRFSVRKKRQRVGRNPKTGVEVPITERVVTIFKPSQLLKKRINA